MICRVNFCFTFMMKEEGINEINILVFQKHQRLSGPLMVCEYFMNSYIELNYLGFNETFLKCK